MMESEFVYLRKFKSVQQFLKGAQSLDHVLENIETFSRIARFMNKGHKGPFETPGEDGIQKQSTAEFGKN